MCSLSTAHPRVLDGEVTERGRRPVVHRPVLCPATSFIEHDIARHAHAPCRRVEHVVGLSPLYIADKDPRRAVIMELADVVQLLDEGEVAEDVQIADRRLAPMLGLIRHLAIECTGRRAVEQVYDGHHGLSPVDRRHATLFEECAHCCHHHLIAALDHAVLLW